FSYALSVRHAALPQRAPGVEGDCARPIVGMSLERPDLNSKTMNVTACQCGSIEWRAMHPKRRSSHGPACKSFAPLGAAVAQSRAEGAVRGVQKIPRLCPQQPADHAAQAQYGEGVVADERCRLGSREQGGSRPQTADRARVEPRGGMPILHGAYGRRRDA